MELRERDAEQVPVRRLLDSLGAAEEGGAGAAALANAGPGPGGRGNEGGEGEGGEFHLDGLMTMGRNQVEQLTAELLAHRREEESFLF